MLLYYFIVILQLNDQLSLSWKVLTFIFQPFSNFLRHLQEQHQDQHQDQAQSNGARETEVWVEQKMLEPETTQSQMFNSKPNALNQTGTWSVSFEALIVLRLWEVAQVTCWVETMFGTNATNERLPSRTSFHCFYARGGHLLVLSVERDLWNCTSGMTRDCHIWQSSEMMWTN